MRKVQFGSELRSPSGLMRRARREQAVESQDIRRAASKVVDGTRVGADPAP